MSERRDITDGLLYRGKIAGSSTRKYWGGSTLATHVERTW